MDSLLPTKSSPPILFLLLLLLLAFSSPCSSKIFNFSTINSTLTKCQNGTGGGICPRGDAVVSNGFIQLTRNQKNDSVGRAYYSDPIPLHQLSNFVTHFSFIIDALNSSNYGDGIAFFLVPFNTSSVPNKSSGGCLGLFSECETLRKSIRDPVVAVEFDSYQNDWDPKAVENETDHVGIDVNTIKSVKTVVWKSGIKKGKTANAWVSYDARSHNLSVFLTYADNPFFMGNSSLSYVINLREVLPLQVAIGFSASTGSSVEIHSILSWDFNYELEVTTSGKGFLNGKNHNSGIVFVALGVAVTALAVSSMILLTIAWKRERERERRERERERTERERERRERESERTERERERREREIRERRQGPRTFPYVEMAKATNNFSPKLILGRGGFGEVYKGHLQEADNDIDVAIKRMTKNSRQGKKEFEAEVNIISRLRHQNLVQLIGWCDERGEHLLIYEYMSNESLEMHLFNPNKPPIPWPVRYKIAQGLASGLVYLHEEWDQKHYVIHRDVKSSNIMLDSNFNAKLGDFGLARLVDHETDGQTTTEMAGTPGYMAPECLSTMRASKESDVYSFGVVVLEIVSGLRAVGLVDVVSRLCGEGSFMDAVDKRILNTPNVDMKQVERLIEVGLWCAQRDVPQRPSMRKAIKRLDDLDKPPLPMTKYFTSTDGPSESGAGQQPIGSSSRQ